MYGLKSYRKATEGKKIKNRKNAPHWENFALFSRSIQKKIDFGRKKMRLLKEVKNVAFYGFFAFL